MGGVNLKCKKLLQRILSIFVLKIGGEDLKCRNALFMEGVNLKCKNTFFMGGVNLQLESC